MLNIIKVTLFVIVNVAGWFTIPVVASLAAKWSFFPQLPPGPHLETFKLWFLGGGMWVWIISALVSVGYFFARDELKNWLLLAPMYGPAIFGVGTLVYFNFFYTIN